MQVQRDMKLASEIGHFVGCTAFEPPYFLLHQYISRWDLRQCDRQRCSTDGEQKNEITSRTIQFLVVHKRLLGPELQSELPYYSIIMVMPQDLF